MLIGLARAPGFDLARIEAFLEIAEILAFVDNFPQDKNKWKNSDILRDVKKTEKSKEYIDLLASSFRMFYEEVIDSGGISTNDWNEWFFDYGRRGRRIKKRISTLAQRISIKDNLDNLGEKINAPPPMGGALAVIFGASAVANTVMKTVVKNAPEGLEEVFPFALNQNLEKLNFENFPLHTPKAMMHELIMVSLCDGEISENKMLLLKQVQNHFGIDDEDFDDLLEQGKNLRKQLDKSTYLILE